LAHSQFDLFLTEATYQDPASDSTLHGDSFYGLYTSWCSVARQPLHPENIFWAAMSERVGPEECLRMKGPAAADYFLTNHQSIL